MVNQVLSSDILDYQGYSTTDLKSDYNSILFNVINEASSLSLKLLLQINTDL